MLCFTQHCPSLHYFAFIASLCFYNGVTTSEHVKGWSALHYTLRNLIFYVCFYRLCQLSLSRILKALRRGNLLFKIERTQSATAYVTAMNSSFSSLTSKPPGTQVHVMCAYWRIYAYVYNMFRKINIHRKWHCNFGVNPSKTAFDIVPSCLLILYCAFEYARNVISMKRCHHFSSWE